MERVEVDRFFRALASVVASGVLEDSDRWGDESRLSGVYVRADVDDGVLHAVVEITLEPLSRVGRPHITQCESVKRS